MLITYHFLSRSEERSQALRLCGWPHDPENTTLSPLLEKMIGDAQTSRAAALAVFHLKIRKAIKILTRSGIQKNGVSYQLVALALAGNSFNQNLKIMTSVISVLFAGNLGFTDNRDTLWQEMCSAQRNALDDPYLRAAFGFLTSTSEKYEAVLVGYKMFSTAESIELVNETF